MSESKEGLLAWSLKARGARMSEKEGLILFSYPKVKFYDGGKLASEITAEAGEMKTLTRDAVLTGGVKVNSKRDGMNLSSSRLYFSSARGKVWTDDEVTINRGKTVIRGRGFTANPDLSEIEIKRQETRLDK